ncbi:MAG: long-chain acyl-CoA synthetase [Proteiniphilum sp.]|nr:long-chain acyl-CoA synthetase [Proteiniphilum sp.]
MLLTASGQNVYPEEIEARLNNLPYVAESVVLLRDLRLVALVYPDMAAVNADQITPKKLDAIMQENRQTLNKSVANYEKISAIELVDNEFKKTPKKSIKRFLYS